MRSNFSVATLLGALSVAGLAWFPACSSEDSELGNNEGVGASAGSGARPGSAGEGSEGGRAGQTGSAGAAGRNGSAGGGGTAGSSDGGSGTGGEFGICGDRPCACNNGEDDDGDGKIDGFDEECTGPNDDDEGSFSTGIPGDNRDPKWQDCFFDGNSGAGDDGCRYHTDCLLGLRESDDPSCEVSKTCFDFCRPRTPNGCDCFGCCEVHRDDGSSIDIVIGGNCSLETIDDEAVCPRCTQSKICNNDCGECELCPGKTKEDLPDHCRPDTPDGGGDGGMPDGGTPDSGDSKPPPDHECNDGEVVCDSSQDCPSFQYCQLGCCLEVIR